MKKLMAMIIAVFVLSEIVRNPGASAVILLWSAAGTAFIVALTATIGIFVRDRERSKYPERYHTTSIDS